MLTLQVEPKSGYFVFKFYAGDMNYANIRLCGESSTIDDWDALMLAISDNGDAIVEIFDNNNMECDLQIAIVNGIVTFSSYHKMYDDPMFEINIPGVACLGAFAQIREIVQAWDV